jgi:hypothetical protein
VAVVTRTRVRAFGTRQVHGRQIESVLLAARS